MGRAAQARLEPDGDLPRLAAEAGYRVKTLAARLGCSTRQLERAFSARFHTGAKRHLDSLRLSPSLPQLLRGDPVKAVAARAGFAHSTHFARAFRRFYGISPHALAVRVPQALNAATVDGRG